jgi:hypothetical protein
VAGVWLLAVALRSNPAGREKVVPYLGQIQVLNASGIEGAALKVSDHLRQQGFDVVECGNNDEWYFKNTIVACRNGNMEMAGRVAAALHTDRLLLLRLEDALLDATVFVGKDFEERIKEL